MDTQSPPPDILALTSQIVAAFVRRNAVPAAEVPALIERTHKALTGLTAPAPDQAAPPPTPAVPVKRSVFPDYIVCLEDGKKLKMLKRHLMTAYGMTPEQYREKWRLPAEYPMVAPNYAEHRSTLAKTIGLGRKPLAAEAEAEADVDVDVEADMAAEPEAPPEPPPARAPRAGKGGRGGKRAAAATETSD